MELGSVHEYINKWLPLAHRSLHQLQSMTPYGLLYISAELELGIIRVNMYYIISNLHKQISLTKAKIITNLLNLAPMPIKWL